MFKFYNTQTDITSGFCDFILNSFPNIRKTQLNFLPSLMFGMIYSESCASSDIAKVLKNELQWAQYDSVVKRINRFFSNIYFDGYFFYKKIISYILDNFDIKHSNKKVFITFDHMFSHDNFTVFLFSMRIGTQAIPIYFQCFKGNNKYSDAFKIDTVLKGIDEIDKLFKDRGFELIFLADRWFNSVKILEYIDSLGHTYCIRLKGNVKVFQNNTKLKAKKLKHRKYHAVVHKDGC